MHSMRVECLSAWIQNLSIYHRKWSITCLPREEGAHVLTNSCMILLQDADLNIDTVLSFLYYGLFGLREQKKLILVLLDINLNANKTIKQKVHIHTPTQVVTDRPDVDTFLILTRYNKNNFGAN
jgi:hypothetical protein